MNKSDEKKMKEKLESIDGIEKVEINRGSLLGIESNLLISIGTFCTVVYILEHYLLDGTVELVSLGYCGAIGIVAGLILAILEERL